MMLSQIGNKLRNKLIIHTDRRIVKEIRQEITRKQGYVPDSSTGQIEPNNEDNPSMDGGKTVSTGMKTNKMHDRVPSDTLAILLLSSGLNSSYQLLAGYYRDQGPRI